MVRLTPNPTVDALTTELLLTQAFLERQYNLLPTQIAMWQVESTLLSLTQQLSLNSLPSMLQQLELLPTAHRHCSELSNRCSYQWWQWNVRDKRNKRNSYKRWNNCTTTAISDANGNGSFTYSIADQVSNILDGTTWILASLEQAKISMSLSLTLFPLLNSLQ